MQRIMGAGFSGNAAVRAFAVHRADLIANARCVFCVAALTVYAAAPSYDASFQGNASLLVPGSPDARGSVSGIVNAQDCAAACEQRPECAAYTFLQMNTYWAPTTSCFLCCFLATRPASGVLPMRTVTRGVDSGIKVFGGEDGLPQLPIYFAGRFDKAAAPLLPRAPSAICFMPFFA